MTKPMPGDFGVFLWDESRPAQLCEYIGEAANGQHVFTCGTIAQNTFKLFHSDPSQFWALF